MPFGPVVSRRIWERGFGEGKATATVQCYIYPDTPTVYSERSQGERNTLSIRCVSVL